MRRILRIIGPCLLAAALAAVQDVALGQSLDAIAASRQRSSLASSYICVTEPEDLTMMVNLWGYVRNPGRYEVSTSADLIQLLSCAGGPGEDASLEDVVITRVTTAGSEEKRTRFTVDLEDLGEIDRTELVLHPGDTIFIDHSDWASFKDVLEVVTTVAIVTTAVASVIISTSR